MFLIQVIKGKLYFPIAHYFRFFAKIQLLIWNPRIIVITGSSGKTTLLHLLESQIGDRAEYSHQANSSFGIPFDILGLKRKTLTFDEWPKLFFLAPFKAFQKIHKKNLYIVEADCDRVGEGKFLATLLKPEVTIWLSSTRTHSMNFPEPEEENIASEFGNFLEYTSKRIFINGDSSLIKKIARNDGENLEFITQKGHLVDYKIQIDSTIFNINGKLYKFNFILPKETFYQIMATLKILKYLDIQIDPSFSKFQLPPGRSSVFKGIKNTTIIDSSYNADLESVRVMLNMFDQFPATNKWVALGDLVEQGELEKEEHEKLIPVLSSMNLKKIILAGPRLEKYVHPKVESVSFISPADALKYIKENISGGETIFFKGARFLEGIIEHLLINKSDITRLCRREKVWQERRKKWEL